MQVMWFVFMYVCHLCLCTCVSHVSVSLIRMFGVIIMYGNWCVLSWRSCDFRVFVLKYPAGSHLSASSAGRLSLGVSLGVSPSTNA